MARKGKNKRKIKTWNKQELTNRILGYFSSNPRRTMNYKQLCKVLGIKDDAKKMLVQGILAELKTADHLEENAIGKYKLKSRAGYIIGKIDLTQAGYGFLVSEELKDDVFIPRNNLNNALDGDTVKVYVYPPRKLGGRLEGEVDTILDRARDTFVGIVEVSDQFAFLITDNRKMPYDLFIPLNKLNGAKNGQKAIAKITDWPSKVKNPFGEIVQVLGNPGENDVEMHSILAEFDLPYQFPPEINAAAEEISELIDKNEIKNRRDFRKIPTFTIDPHDAKDFDDALSLQKLDNGNWEVGVHIADVSHYVTKNSILDQEAYDRATSVYLVDRVVPMLPERLSNFICSLRPDEEKLCFSAVFEMNDKAEVQSEWLGRTIIKSKKRFAYEDAQAIIMGEDGDMKDQILTLNQLAIKLKKVRFSKGAIAFDRVEVKFHLDEQGVPTGVYFKEQKEANHLIEEFMLLANRTVAEYIDRGGKYKQEVSGGKMGDVKAKTFVYRIHDKPDPEKLESFNRFISKFGYSIDISSSRKMSISMNHLLDEVEGKKEQNVVETLALRSMAKARYSTENIGHYGLAFQHYTHFTSPIRRYPDMMVHRLLAGYLENGDSKNKKKYEEYCKHSSDMEKKSMDAERASTKYKQVEFMKGREGEVFDAIISGLTNFGIYAEIIENKCEGMIAVQSLADDFFEFDEENYMLVGRHTKKKFQLGDEIKIEVKNVNLPKRQLDFSLANEL
jgi:ribonuclease R